MSKAFNHWTLFTEAMHMHAYYVPGREHDMASETASLPSPGKLTSTLVGRWIILRWGKMGIGLGIDIRVPDGETHV